MRGARGGGCCQHFLCRLDTRDMSMDVIAACATPPALADTPMIRCYEAPLAATISEDIGSQAAARASLFCVDAARYAKILSPALPPILIFCPCRVSCPFRVIGASDASIDADATFTLSLLRIRHDALPFRRLFYASH